MNGPESDLNIAMNYGVLSFSVIICGTLIKVFGVYWVFAVVACLSVAILSFLAVLLSSTSENDLNAVLRSPLEQKVKVKLGLGCEYTSDELPVPQEMKNCETFFRQRILGL